MVTFDQGESGIFTVGHWDFLDPREVSSGTRLVFLHEGHGTLGQNLLFGRGVECRFYTRKEIM